MSNSPLGFQVNAAARPSSPISSPHLSLPRRLETPRSSSPTPSLVRQAQEANAKKLFPVRDTMEPEPVAVGLLDDATLSQILPSWRLRLRAPLAKSLDNEMPYLQWIQSSCRTPNRDIYFTKTSLFGSHTFFMIFIPTFFWYGQGDIGRGLLYILAAGGYFTSVLKDFFCIARPYSPPLHRLTVGNHHHEYGFPSTHSTTTVAMALYFSSLVLRYSTQPVWIDVLAYFAFAFFAVTVVFGRLYTGMHSMVDVATGAVIGVIVWAAYYFLEEAVESFTLSSAWKVTCIMVPSILFLVFVHPAPAEDCPCFEDAVAFVSVLLGIVVGRAWCHTDFVHPTLGTQWNSVLNTSVWSGAVLVKLFLGILSIFAWRIFAKEVAHRTLPPLFRLFSSFLLPRRHYIVATEYEDYKKTDVLHPVPSILDLPSLDTDDDADVDSAPSSPLSRESPPLPYELRNRGNGSINEDPLVRKQESRQEPAGRKKRKVEEEDPIRRDADVLTKVFVYSGIGWIATIGVPKLFLAIGLSA